MARMYPNQLSPDTESDAERRLYQAFQDELDDSYTVFHSAAWLSQDAEGRPRDGEADFVIVHPQRGILVMEAKGGRIRYSPRTGRWTSTDRHGQTHNIKDPFAQGNLGAIRLREGAACTSGNYARFVVIDGKRYSHILDPRSGRPAEAVPSAVVVAPTAMGADIWATALSVLGQDGLDRLPQGVEALVILGSEEDRQFICTPGLRPLLLVAESSQVEVWGERRGQGAAR